MDVAITYRAHAQHWGRRDDGSWRTADAKTYPPGLCRILGDAITENAAHRWPWLRDVQGEDNNLASLYQPLDPYQTEQSKHARDTFFSSWVV